MRDGDDVLAAGSMILYALVDLRHGQTVETYVTREEADRRKVIADVPQLEGLIVVKEIELSELSPN